MTCRSAFRGAAAVAPLFGQPPGESAMVVVAAPVMVVWLGLGAFGFVGFVVGLLR